MDSNPVLRYIIAGDLQRNFILPPDGKPFLDIPGGSSLYAYSGLRIWDSNIGIISQINKSYPKKWLDKLHFSDADIRGISSFNNDIDIRNFFAYDDNFNLINKSPIHCFRKRSLPIPHELLDYGQSNENIVHHLNIRKIPKDYLDCTAAYIGPHTFSKQLKILSYLKIGQFTTIILETSKKYMNPFEFEKSLTLFNGLSALITTDLEVKNLFKGRENDLWKIAKQITNSSCEIVIIRCSTGNTMIFEKSTNKKWVVPSYQVTIKDMTGVNNAFCGGFLAGLRLLYHPLEAAINGIVSASFASEFFNPFQMLNILPGLANERRMKLSNEAVQV